MKPVLSGLYRENIINKQIFKNRKYLNIIVFTDKLIQLRFRKVGRVWCGGVLETH